jgi:hypothetical protein
MPECLRNVLRESKLKKVHGILVGELKSQPLHPESPVAAQGNSCSVHCVHI